MKTNFVRLHLFLDQSSVMYRGRSNGTANFYPFRSISYGLQTFFEIQKLKHADKSNLDRAAGSAPSPSLTRYAASRSRRRIFCRGGFLINPIFLNKLFIMYLHNNQSIVSSRIFDFTVVHKKIDSFE